MDRKIAVAIKYFAAVGAVILIATGCFFTWALYAVRAKIVRRATATVVKKEHLRFDEAERFFINDEGNRVMLQGDEQWRVYYVIDGFPEEHGRTTSEVLVSEKRRADEGRERFQYDYGPGGLYDKVAVGDRIYVMYQSLGGARIRVVSEDLMDH